LSFPDDEYPHAHVRSSNNSDDDPKNNDIIAVAASSSSMVTSKPITPIMTTTLAAKNPVKQQSSSRKKYKNLKKPFSYFDNYKLITENGPMLEDEITEHNYSKPFFRSHLVPCQTVPKYASMQRRYNCDWL
jgi:hypothetical protein